MKRLVGILAAFVLAFGVMPPPASAVDYYVIVYEDINGGGDSWRINVGTLYPNNYSYLGNYNNGLTPTCNKANGVATANWNDCISSYRVYLNGYPGGLCFRMYEHSNYTFPATGIYSTDYARGTLVNFNHSTGLGDKVSSIKWTYGGTAGGCP